MCLSINIQHIGYSQFIKGGTRTSNIFSNTGSFSSCKSLPSAVVTGGIFVGGGQGYEKLGVVH